MQRAHRKLTLGRVMNTGFMEGRELKQTLELPFIKGNEQQCSLFPSVTKCFLLNSHSTKCWAENTLFNIPTFELEVILLIL